MIILPKDDLEKQEMLSKIAKSFEADKEYTEQEVSDMIKSFDVDDYVLFRRELVNFNYLAKDSYRGVYWLKKTVLSEAELAAIRKRQEKVDSFS